MPMPIKFEHIKDAKTKRMFLYMEFAREVRILVKQHAEQIENEEMLNGFNSGHSSAEFANSLKLKYDWI